MNDAINKVYTDSLSCSFALGNGKMAGGARGKWLYTLCVLALVIADDLETPINEARKPELLSAFIFRLLEIRLGTLPYIERQLLSLKLVVQWFFSICE